MRTYQSPGIYREEVFPAPALEFLTGVPVFVGFASRTLVDSCGAGYLLEPLRASDVWLVRDREMVLDPGVSGKFTLWPTFMSSFGPLLAHGYLASAVRGFFQNGGNQCFVQILCWDTGVAVSTALELGLERLEALEAADLVCTPDIMLGGEAGGSPDPDQVRLLQTVVLGHCDRLGDRFAILDSRSGLDAQSVILQRQRLSGLNGALYYPWVRTANSDQAPGGFIPPCGHVAGVFARSDRTIGVHKAPANEVLEGVLDLEVNVTSAVQDLLNPAGVNCLRAFPGRGIRVWGARTLADPVRHTEWVYINVRRLLITVARRIESTMQWVVMEPNDERLWVRISRELTSYLGELYRQGAFKGGSTQEAFQVKCDAETNPAEVRDAGLVVTEIHLAPTVPGEFVVVRIIQGAGGVSVAAGQAAADVTAVAAPTVRLARQDVRLTHIEYNPHGWDIAGEYVVIRNQGNRDVAMTGWTLNDKAYHTFVFPPCSLPPGASLRVWTKKGTDSSSDLYWGRASAVWNNIGDTGYLRDPNGTLMDVYSYTP
jgi:uncharacterized protein